MLILAIDQSSATGSAALLDNERSIAECKWSGAPPDRQRMFPLLKGMFSDAGVAPRDIGLYAIGAGPGSYSGLRMAMAAVQSMALPGKTGVYALTSAEILAWQVSESSGFGRVKILGDARRNQWWMRSYVRANTCMAPEGGWKLINPGECEADDKEAVATPDWERIGGALRDTLPSSVMLIARAIIPEAVTLGRLACARMALGMPSEPLEPVYLHAAVNSKFGTCQ